MKEKFWRWLDGSREYLEDASDMDETPYREREEVKTQIRERNDSLDKRRGTRAVIRAEEKGFRLIYSGIAVISAIFLIGVLLYVVSYLPRYGQENPQTTLVARRYLEDGVRETGAINAVAGMILDYRAFDTLGESHVLFTALVCVMILLEKDRKNMRRGYEDYYRITGEGFYTPNRDGIMQAAGFVLLPSILLFGIYILLNGQNGPGGGFSGGTVLGSGLIIFTMAFGFDTVDRIASRRLLKGVTVVALGFYSFAKGYVFFTGANGLESHIPKGTPGAILSGGLILPLDIAVGLVVACTMFGFYSLFRRGSIGGKGKACSGKKAGTGAGIKAEGKDNA